MTSHAGTVILYIEITIIIIDFLSGDPFSLIPKMPVDIYRVLYLGTLWNQRRYIYGELAYSSYSTVMTSITLALESLRV